MLCEIGVGDAQRGWWAAWGMFSVGDAQRDQRGRCSAWEMLSVGDAQRGRCSACSAWEMLSVGDAQRGLCSVWAMLSVLSVGYDLRTRRPSYFLFSVVDGLLSYRCDSAIHIPCVLLDAPYIIRRELYHNTNNPNY